MIDTRISGGHDAAVYDARVREILDELGITADYIATRGLPLQREAAHLVSVGADIFGRERQLAPAAATRWVEMQSAAADDGVSVLLVSAFRSVFDQRRVFVRKINDGRPLDEILRFSAPPGYSEHHNGCAVDIATPGSRPLTEAFERTAAFAWLRDEASRFGFFLSYPPGNRYGFAYEPWHWALADDLRHTIVSQP